MELPRHFAPRNDTTMRLFHSVRNDIKKELGNYQGKTTGKGFFYSLLSKVSLSGLSGLSYL
jgi:hypothetical protein